MPSSKAPQEIRISEAMLHKLGFLLLGIATAFIFIGALVSPRDEQGNPILLSPDVKAIQEYRTSAREWMNGFSILDDEIDRMINRETQGDLFTQSQSAQDTLQQAVALAQQIDRASVPPIAVGLHDLEASTAMAYVEAARTALQWISAPEQSNHDLAVKNLGIARKSKDDLEANQWLTSP
jgi:hypothetical protein